MKIKEVKVIKNKPEFNSRGAYYYRAVNKARKPVIYFHVDQESITDDLIKRHHRPHKEYKKLIKEALTLAGLPIDSEYKWTWNPKAGCSMCPCSPGFTPNNMSSVPFNVITGNSIYVTITE